MSDDTTTVTQPDIAFAEPEPEIDPAAQRRWLLGQAMNLSDLMEVHRVPPRSDKQAKVAKDARVLFRKVLSLAAELGT